MSGIRSALVRDIAREESGLALLADVSALLKQTGRDEADIFRDLLSMLAAARLAAVLAMTSGQRYRGVDAPQNEARDTVLERCTFRAVARKRPVWCCREPVLQPLGAVEQDHDEVAPTDLAAAGLEWVLSVPIAAGDAPLGALTTYGQADEPRFPSLALVRAIAERIGDVIGSRREHEALLGAIRRRETAMATVAHDLRGSLNVVWMAVHAGSSGAPAIARHVRRMEMLVSDILETGIMTSQSLSLDRAPCAPDVLLAEAVAYVEPLAAAKHIRFCVAVETNLPRIVADARRIEQVLANMLGNAVKFTPANGSIDAGCMLHAEGLAFYVKDSGPGISVDEREHVFERFWKGASRSGGAGLGLAIAHDIVRAHGGRIWVESEPGEGAKLVFTIPLDGRD